MPAADRVPLALGPVLPAVRVRLNDAVNVILAVDTGAQRLLISRASALALGLDLSRPLRAEPLAGVGSTPPVPVVRLDRVQVGGSAVAGLEASVYDLPPFIRADGLLGLPFLRRFRVTFEFDTSHLVLRPPPPRRTP